MGRLLAVIPKSVPQAKRALAALERDIDSASTYDAIRKIERFADAVKLLFFEVEEIRRHAEKVIVLANHRIGRGLASVSRGGRPSTKTASRKDVVLPSLKDAVGSQRRGVRLRRLAAIPADEVKRVVGELQDAGKEATISGVLSFIKDTGKAQRRAQRERDLGEKIAAGNLALPAELFGVIVGDPQRGRTVYSEETGMDRHAANHYATGHGTEERQDDKIKALPVASIAAPHCVLGLRCVDPHRGVDVMRAWGFKPKSYFVWCKDIIEIAVAADVREALGLGPGRILQEVGAQGTGFWNRDRDELMLIGVRGHPVCPAPGTQGESVWFARRGEHAATRDDSHSDKPDVALEWFERHFPNTPKIELFARRACPGWKRWGAEAPPPVDDRGETGEAPP